MKTKILVAITLLLQITFIFAQSPFPTVTAGNYSRCDTCFTFTAHPDTLNNNNPPYTYQWKFKGASPATDTGQTVNYCSRFVAIPGADSIELIITDGQGQLQYYYNTLTGLLPDLGLNTTIQPICIISVDTAVNKNLVVWDQTSDTNITSYNLYKETSTSGVFDLLTNIPRQAFSDFTDTASQPDVKSARYYITTLDACGTES